MQECGVRPRPSEAARTRTLPARLRAPGVALALVAGLGCPKPPPDPLVAPSPPAAAAAGTASTARVEVRAPIVRLSVRVAESFPPQYFADVTSALPDGCANFARTALRREGDDVFVDVLNTRPSRDDMACTMIYGEHETAVALGSDFVPGKTYTVDANGTRESFTAQ
jgi:hypothetical protein